MASWYLIAEQALPKEIGGKDGALALLAAAKIASTEGDIQSPITASGIAFAVPEGRLDIALECLGLSAIAFDRMPTNMQHVVLLHPRGVRTRAAAQEVGDETPGRDVFADQLLAADAARITKFRAELLPLRNDVERLRAELTEAARRLHFAELRLTVYEQGTSKLLEHLRAAYDAIASDPRIAVVATSATHFVVTTRELILASDPPRLIGRLRIVFAFADGTLRITALDGLAEYPHPSVSKEGVPFLGMYQEVFLRRIAKYEYDIAMRLLLDFLVEPPIGETIPTMRPEAWPEADDAVRERIARAAAASPVPA